MSNENEEERGEKGRREGENETGTVERRCLGSCFVGRFDVVCQGRDLESCGDLSWEDLLDKLEDLSDRESEAWVAVLVVIDMTDVLVSFSSVVSEFCDGLSCCSDWKHVEPQSFSFSNKRARCVGGKSRRDEL